MEIRILASDWSTPALSLLLFKGTMRSGGSSLKKKPPVTPMECQSVKGKMLLRPTRETGGARCEKLIAKS